MTLTRHTSVEALKRAYDRYKALVDAEYPNDEAVAAASVEAVRLGHEIMNGVGALLRYGATSVVGPPRIYINTAFQQDGD